ncbi:unnamed protein product [Penicillium bialowiezense]
MPPYALEPPRSPGNGQFRLPPPPGMPTCVPPLPPAWEGTERMSEWLKAKAEEDKRRQEEEKTRQANLLLEQRRVEQAMLLDSLRAGVPAHLIPMIFNGMHTSGANPQLATELQRQWSAPRVAAPQQPPRQTQQASFPIQQNPLYQPAPQPAPQQPPQIPNAFENTFPVISSLNQGGRAHSQSTISAGSSDGGETKKSVEYHFYTPQKMDSPRPQQPSQPHFKLPPLPQPKGQAPPGTPASNATEVKVTSFPPDKAPAKRKNKKEHERLPPPASRPPVQRRATDRHGDQTLRAPQTGAASGPSNLLGSDGWEEKPTKDAMSAVLDALDRQRTYRAHPPGAATATRQAEDRELKSENAASPDNKSD